MPTKQPKPAGDRSINRKKGRKKRRVLKAGQITCRKCSCVFKIKVQCPGCGERLSPDDARLDAWGRYKLEAKLRQEKRLEAIRRALEAKARAEGWGGEADPLADEIDIDARLSKLLDTDH